MDKSGWSIRRAEQFLGEMLWLSINDLECWMSTVEYQAPNSDRYWHGQWLNLHFSFWKFWQNSFGNASLQMDMICRPCILMPKGNNLPLWKKKSNRQKPKKPIVFDCFYVYSGTSICLHSYSFFHMISWWLFSWSLGAMTAHNNLYVWQL